MWKILICVISAIALLLIYMAAYPAGTAGCATASESSRDSYWISSTGKTHNSSCRYSGKGKGEWSTRPSGDNCKICGGSSK